MKRFGFILLTWFISGTILAQEKSAESDRKIPLDSLLQRSVAIVKRPAIFEWRKSPLILLLQTGQPVEYNNYNSEQLGLDIRLPGEAFGYRMSIVKVTVSDSRASRLLAQTPYFQAGRPSRIEWQHGLEMPLVEGIGNQLWSWLPQTQFVLSGIAQINSAFYAGQGMSGLKNVVNPKLTSEEIDRISEKAPPAMRVSRARHDIGIGLQWDNYFSPGLYWSARALWNSSPAAASDDLKSWTSFTAGVGYAF